MKHCKGAFFFLLEDPRGASESYSWRAFGAFGEGLEGLVSGGVRKGPIRVLGET